MTYLPTLAGIGAVMIALTSVGQNATQVYWRSAQAMTEFEHKVMVVDEASATFYASQFFLPSGRAGYIGLQTHDHPRQMILFSVWDAEEAEPGSEGTYCQRFGGEGVGYSCRLFRDHLWTRAVTYTLRVEIEDEWISGFVRGSDGLSVDLGRIRRAGETDLGVSNVAFIENWNFHCQSAPHASALFFTPTSGEMDAEYVAHPPDPACAPAANGPFDGGIYVEIGGDGTFGSDDRARINSLLTPPEHIPLSRRPWWRTLWSDIRADSRDSR